MRIPILCATLLVAAACSGSANPPVVASAPATIAPAVVATAPPPTPAPTPAPTVKRTFPSGIYVIHPALDNVGGPLDLIESTGQLPTPVMINGGVAFDILPDVVVSLSPSPTMSALQLTRADGTSQRVEVKAGLYGLDRPSLSPDGKFVAVQATETPLQPNQGPRFLTIYVIELATGQFRRLTPIQENPMTGLELPKWFPSGDRILHQGVDFTRSAQGCDYIRVVDATTGNTLVTINKDGPSGCFSPGLPGRGDGLRFHAEVSADSSRILIPGEMKIFDAKTAALLGDIRKQAMDGLTAAGYQPDSRFGGQGGGGTFPLDGSFSPDGKQIVFDGAVMKDGQFGEILCRINVDGTGFTVLRPPVPFEPRFSNNDNYSQLAPHWR